MLSGTLMLMMSGALLMLRLAPDRSRWKAILSVTSIEFLSLTISISKENSILRDC